MWKKKLRKIYFLMQKSILNWFRLNSLKANLGKFQFMILRDKPHRKHVVKINSIKVEASEMVYC